MLVAAATAFQVSPATEMLRPPPPEAVTAVRGRDRLHQPSSQPPEGKGKVRHSSGSSWHSGHPCAQRGLGREPGLRECQGSLPGWWQRGGHAHKGAWSSGCPSLQPAPNYQKGLCLPVQGTLALLYLGSPPMQGSVLDLGRGQGLGGERSMDTSEGGKEQKDHRSYFRTLQV